MPLQASTKTQKYTLPHLDLEFSIGVDTHDRAETGINRMCPRKYPKDGGRFNPRKKLEYDVSNAVQH